MRALPFDFNGFDQDRLDRRRACGRGRIGGATLLELSIVVAAVAVLAAFALPRFDAAREAARSNAAHQALLASLMVAPGRAASAGVEVVVCPGTPAGCTGTHDWSGGWIVFADPDGDRARDPASEMLLHHAGPLGGRTHLRTTAGRTRLVFQPDGSATGSNVTFTLCDGRGAKRAVALVMNNAGALRAVSASPAQAGACVAAM